MNELTLEQIEKERKSGKIIMLLSILKNEIARINSIGFPTVDDSLIKKYSAKLYLMRKEIYELCATKY